MADPGASRRVSPSVKPGNSSSPWTLSEIKWRRDDNKPNTTFGRLRFPWSAFRDPKGRTRNPARDLSPHYSRIRSSELLLEWECALATDHPFRKAAEALLFFSHGAADVEDTTIERYAVRVGNALPVEWLYRKPEDIRNILRDTATRNNATGNPIVYASRRPRPEAVRTRPGIRSGR